MKISFLISFALLVVAPLVFANDRPTQARPFDWQTVGLGAVDAKEKSLTYLTFLLQQRTGVPIHTACSDHTDSKRITLTLVTEATLLDAVNALRKELPGLEFRATGRGVLLTHHLSERASELLKVSQPIPALEGTMQDVIDKCVGEKFHQGKNTRNAPTDSNRIHVKTTTYNGTSITDFLASVAEKHGLSMNLTVLDKDDVVPGAILVMDKPGLTVSFSLIEKRPSSVPTDGKFSE